MLYLMRHGQDDPTVRGGWSGQPWSNRVKQPGIKNAQVIGIAITEEDI